MGDIAVAVHPQSRYKDLVGKKVRRPFPEGEIPVIADELVDPEFGTGSLKITPAHSKDDFEIARKHGLIPEGMEALKKALETIDVLTPNGKINCRGVPEL